MMSVQFLVAILVCDYYRVFCLLQLTPFPYDLVLEEVTKYKRAKVVWAQEEHKNMGAFAYVQPRIETVLKKQGSRRPVM